VTTDDISTEHFLKSQDDIMKSLEEGILPKGWKMAVVVLIFKKRQQARSQ